MQPENQDITVEEDDITQPHLNSVIKQRKRHDAPEDRVQYKDQKLHQIKFAARTSIRKRKISNENLIDDESIEINSRLSDSHREVRSSQIKKETMREVAKR